VVSAWSPEIYVNIEPIILVTPLNNAYFSSCSLYSLPTFAWIVGESFKSYEIQFSSDESFSSIAVRVRVSATTLQTVVKSSIWKKVLSTAAISGGTVHWRVIGTKASGTKATSEVRSILIEPNQALVNVDILHPSKSTLPIMFWQNNCNIKFKVWFGSDESFSKKVAYSFNIKNPNENEGDFEKMLTSKQWTSIRKLVGDISGSTIYWYVESWDGLGRYAKADVMSFVLTD
jgi:hypothetical protein